MIGFFSVNAIFLLEFCISSTWNRMVSSALISVCLSGSHFTINSYCLKFQCMVVSGVLYHLYNWLDRSRHVFLYLSGMF